MILRTKLTRIQRCLTIARSHALLPHPKNALALLARATEKCKIAHAYISSQMDTSDSSPPNISISPTEVTFLKDLLDGELQHYRALVELSNLTSSKEKAEQGTRQPLVERLNDYPSQGIDLQNLVTYPPKLEPIPVKPLFFDAAWNYIEYPGREVHMVDNRAQSEKVSQSKEQTAEQKKKGWFGFGR
jgi:signal recognition particle subunit SRP68